MDNNFSNYPIISAYSHFFGKFFKRELSIWEINFYGV